MSSLRSVFFGTVVVAGASVVGAWPAQADPDAGFYIGPDGARIYYDDDGYSNRRCHTEVWHTWRYGERTRVVDRVCYSRFGRRYIVDRDYYPAYRWDW